MSRLVSILFSLWLLAGTAEACLPYHAVQDHDGNTVPGLAVLSVNLAGTTTKATIYSDPACTTVATNPVSRGTTDWSFWATDGVYDLIFSLGNIQFSHFYGVSLFGAGVDSIVNVKASPYNCKGDDATDDSACLQSAITTGKTVFVPEGTYRAHGLTQSAHFQQFFGLGPVRIKKNANGVLFTSSGNNVQITGIIFSGDAASPTFTGDNLNFSGDNVLLLTSGSRWAAGRAVKSTGQHFQLVGTSDIYQTTDATASGYDIELGVSGTATLYHNIVGWYSSQSTGGLLTVDTGSVTINASQFGKLRVNAGTSPVGVNGGNYTGNRILGATTVNLSSSTFAANHFGAVQLTFASGTSGHGFNEDNVLDASAPTISDLSSFSTIVDRREMGLQSYTPAWTASVANPTLGNGTIFGRYAKRGSFVDVSFELNVGSTTTFGTGTYFFSLPFVPTNTFSFHGSGVILNAGATFYVAVPVTLQDGTARCHIFVDNAANVIGPAIPGAWATGDHLKFTMRYSTG